MSRLRLIIPLSAALLAGSWLAIPTAGATGQASRDNVTVTIVGTESFLPTGEHSTFRFPAAPTKVRSGGFITFDNQTNDGHTMTLIASADVPTSFRCQVCDQVNGTYFTGNGPPAGFNIDNGVINDDDGQADADLTDPGGNAIEDFDTVSHSNGPAPATIGDSALVDANGSNNNGFATTRVVQVTAPAGTTLHYICTFHPWMHGTIQVVN